MNYLFTPSSLFRAWTLTAQGDPDIADGVHARVWFDPRLGLPLTPFVAAPLNDANPAQMTSLWREDRGYELTLPINVQEFSFVEVHISSSVHYGCLSSPCWVKIEADPGSRLEASLIDRSIPGRVLARWVDESPVVTGPEVVRIRLRGTGRVTGLTAIDLSQLIASAGRAEPAITFGLPVDGELPWYTKGQGRAAADTRILEGAPSRLGPPDVPDGTVVPADPNDEVARLKAFGTEVVDWAKAAVSNASEPSPLVRIAFDDSAQPTPQFPKTTAAGINAAHALAMTAIDPGIARLLGFATRLTEKVPPPPRPMAWIVGGVFAINPKPESPNAETLNKLLGAPNSAEVVMALAFRNRFPAISQMQGRLPPGWTLRFLFTGMAYGPAPERLLPPDAQANATGTWNVGRPSATWSQTITLDEPPLGPLALAFDNGVKLVSLSDWRPTQGKFPRRRSMLSAGRNKAGSPTLADLKVPDTATQGRWSVWQADVFGRWSEAGTVEAAQPPRPRPQPPSIQTNVKYADGETPGDEPRSPGTLDLVVPIPPVSGLAPGARPIASLRLTIDGGTPQLIAVVQPVNFDPTAQVRRSLAFGPATIGGSASLSVKAEFIDDAGAESVSEIKTPVARDPRRPPAIPRGPTLIWTSRRDSTGSAEIALAWSVLPGHAAYRVYLSDEKRLAASLTHPLPPPSGPTRTDMAKLVSDHASEFADKRAFSLLSETPLLAPASGPAHFRARVPGSLSGVLFARVVPLTGGNVEARFVDCGLVCLAVPHDQLPPAPTLRVAPREDGRFDITVEGIGFRPALLDAFQPNLLSQSPGTPGAAPPEIRLRRTQGANTEALYAREVQQDKMTIEPDSSGARWSWVKPDGPAEGFPPFVRFTWFAEVRYPAEIGRIVGGADVPSGIVADGGAVEGDMESPWSEASVPQTAMIVLPPPAAPDLAVAQRLATGAEIKIPNPPVASPLAVAPYRVRIWRRDANTPFTLLTPDAPSAAPFSVIDPVAAVEYAIVYVDPIGRVGPITVVPVP